MKKIGQWFFSRRKDHEANEPTDKVPTAQGTTAKEQTVKTNEIESNAVKYPFPKAAFFLYAYIIFNGLGAYFVESLITIYLNKVLLFSENHATAIFHGSSALSIIPLFFGAYISDSYLGKFRSITYFTIIYLVGTYIFLASSFPGMPHRTLYFVSFLLKAFGGGSTGALITTIGGDQFKIPEQAKQLSIFFAIFYFGNNISACVAFFVSPILKKQSCLGMDTCYPLSYGMASAFLTLSLVIFVSGKRLYKIKKPEVNIICKVLKCISHAIVMRRKLKKTDKKNHWLDYASDKYDLQLITDIKAVFSIIILFIPLPFYHALYNQQSSTWVLQAKRMTGSLGKFTIQTEHMQILNPFLIMIFIPIFEFLVYPLCDKIRFIRTPLQKFGAGIVLTSVSFAISAVVEYLLQISKKDSIHILWQIPQYSVLTMGEILLSVQALGFTYSQAPLSMKAVVFALYVVTIIFGNLIVVLITAASLFTNMMYELIFFCAMLLVVFFVFLVLAIRYKYHTYLNE